MEDRNKNTDGRDIPICRFGPGGDYVDDWPLKIDYTPQIDAGPIGKLLEHIACFMGVNVEGLNDIPNGSETIELSTKQVKNKDDIKEPSHEPAMASNAQTNTNSANHSRYTEQPTLFYDSRPTRKSAGQKPKHSLRARRRTKRKRSSCQGSSWQGSLFETGPQSTKVA